MSIRHYPATEALGEPGSQLWITVRPSRRGQGIGRRLLAEACKFARAQGITTAVVELAEGNEAGRHLIAPPRRTRSNIERRNGQGAAVTYYRPPEGAANPRQGSAWSAGQRSRLGHLWRWWTPVAAWSNPVARIRPGGFQISGQRL
ncbi:GNAT family N-acetyltransferase [Actinomadura vinacea]|uniref:GNAT family N-acetyltransferase n=1 Tax=Actinomadura vinacea TaxID=115336 RepID=UPI003CD0745B